MIYIPPPWDKRKRARETVELTLDKGCKMGDGGESVETKGQKFTKR